MLRSSHIFIILCLLGLSVTLENTLRFSSEIDNEGGNSLSRKNHFSSDPITVTVSLQQVLNVISSHFVGVTIDTGQIQHNWNTLDFRSQKVQNMARALTPTFFRLGGTSADAMSYELNENKNSWPVERKAPAAFNMSGDQWEAVNNFAETVGWDFIMDLNALKRKNDGSWDPYNAGQLLQFSAERNFTIAGFELGNEYNLYQRQFGITVSASQLAKDVAAVQQLLSEFPRYYSAFIIGPETAGIPPKYFQGFLAAGGAKVVRAASFHHYYFAGADRNLSYFTDIKLMDSLASELDNVLAQIRSVNPHLPAWLSETSSAYNGGAVNISDRFAAGFLWLDKLGLCAVKGIQTVIRQDFYGGNYGLIDNELNPNPDFWLTVLYKKVVRGPVFNTTGRQDVRVYSACANPENFMMGSLVVYILNPNESPVAFNFQQFPTHEQLIFSLTAGDNDGLLSKYTALNGVKLELVNNQVPDLKPALSPPGRVTTLPYSFTFVVFPGAKVSICMELH